MVTGTPTLIFVQDGKVVNITTGVEGAKALLSIKK